MVSMLAVMAVFVVLGLCVLVIGERIRSFRRKEAGWSARLLGVLVLVVLITLPIYALVKISSTPPAMSINDDLEITDATQQLSIRSIGMPAPAYVSGEGIFEKLYTSVVAVEVENSSDQELYLGMDYYANSGSIGPYSPGAASQTRILPVPANWSGQLEYPVRHPRFLHGGNLTLTLVKCLGASPDHVSPRDAAPLFEKTYDMVSAQ